MDKRYQTVVQGEASESDEEEELNNNEPASIVVDGEAEETDEEELDTSQVSASGRKELPPLKLSESVSSFEVLEDIAVSPSEMKPNRPKHDTILNRRLWESNLSFCTNINALASHTYLQAAKDITYCSSQLSKSHTLIQDVSHNMRLMTNDLFNLQDRIDIVTTCTILPDIVIPQRNVVSSVIPSTPPPVQAGVSASS